MRCSIVRWRRVFGWPLYLSTSPNKRTLYNFPMQGNGAEMLRLAAWRLCEAGIVPNMLMHDGMLIEVQGEEQIEHAKDIMRAAGREVCDGLEIGVDVDQRLEGRRALPRQAAGSEGDVGNDDVHIARRWGLVLVSIVSTAMRLPCCMTYFMAADPFVGPQRLAMWTSSLPTSPSLPAACHGSALRSSAAGRRQPRSPSRCRPRAQQRA